MKEDEEEGHFDETGNFIFDKKTKEIQDAWLDDIDWSLVKKKAGDQWEGDDKKEEQEEETEAVQMSEGRKKEIFEELVEILKPNQSIAKALADLKKQKGLSAAEERKLRWAAKKAGKTFEQTDGQKETSRISGLADELISAGFVSHILFVILQIPLFLQMDAYEWHREKINFQLQRMIKPAVDDLDMFSDEPSTSAPAAPIDIPNDEDQVKWEYKENEDAKIQVSGKLKSYGLATEVDARKVLLWINNWRYFLNSFQMRP